MVQEEMEELPPEQIVDLVQEEMEIKELGTRVGIEEDSGAGSRRDGGAGTKVGSGAG